MSTARTLGEYDKHGKAQVETVIRPEKITWITATNPDAVLALQMLFQTYFAAVEDALMLVGDEFTETLYSTAPNSNRRLSEYISRYIQREAAGNLPTTPSRYEQQGAGGIMSAHTARTHANHLNYIGIFVKAECRTSTSGQRSSGRSFHHAVPSHTVDTDQRRTVPAHPRR